MPPQLWANIQSHYNDRPTDREGTSVNELVPSFHKEAQASLPPSLEGAANPLFRHAFDSNTPPLKRTPVLLERSLRPGDTLACIRGTKTPFEFFP